MAAVFYAKSRIKHGIDHRKDDDPTYVRHETVWFQPGEKVTGLSADEMKALWDAGVLERREESGSRKSESAKSRADNSDDSEKPAA